MSSVMLLWSLCMVLWGTLTEVSGEAGTGHSHFPVVDTRYGTLRGKRSTVGNDSYVDVFHNIPYAQPPVGRLRFEKPLFPHNWTGVRDATKPGAQCPQRHRNLPPSRVFVNDEDCLYLNVYRPKTAGNGPLPVMVWIHGGSYYVSTGNYYDGRQLAAKGVVVVTINYRLDALGFFTMESTEAPGNYGLWDMIRALQWVRDDISAFNGDPNDVTIFGESSGSTSVSLLALSQAAQGLFQKAIMESGVSLTPWAIEHHGVWPEARRSGRTLAKGLHCDASDTQQILACLRTKDAMAIVIVSTEMQKQQGTILFGPVIEATFDQHGMFSATPQPGGEGSFDHLEVFSATPLTLLERGFFNNVTAIRGYNRFESSVSDPENDGISVEEFQKTVHNLVAWYAVRLSSLRTDTIVNLLLDAYITAPNITDPVKIRDAALQLKTDYSFVAPTIKELTLTTARNPNPQYLYQFSYHSANRQSPQWQGAEHADDLHYVFGSPISDDYMWNGFVTSWTDDDKRVSDDVMTLWTNFAKYGNPTPDANTNVKWLPWTPTNPNYLDIGSTDRAMSGIRTRQLELWTNTIFRPERGPDAIIG